MTSQPTKGIGELLRHLSDLFDQDAERIYDQMALNAPYRARYTPLLRSMGSKALSVTEIQQDVRITQGAVSQTLKLMEADGLISRVSAPDQRMRKVRLSDKGLALKKQLTAEWELHIDVIGELEQEIGLPLREQLETAIGALETESYFDRIQRRRSG